MRKHLKYLPGLICLSLTAAALSPLSAQYYDVEQEVYQDANPGQKQTIQDLENRIYRLTKNIQTYESVLKATGRTNEQGFTRVPMRAEQQTYWGQYDKRFVYNEVAVIAWRGTRIRYIMFEQRQSHRKRPQVLIRRWYGQLVARPGPTEQDPGIFEGIALDLVTRRIDTYEGGLYVDKRLFTGRDLRDIDKGTPLPADSGEKVETLPRIYVNQVTKRIQYLREYRQSLELLERRIDRAVRELRNRNETRFELLDRALR